MAATSDEQMESLLSGFDQIYEDFKAGLTEIQSLKSNFTAEVKRREALEITCNSLKLDNERLTKMYTESLSKVADQLEHRSKCQSLKKELKKLNDEYLSKEDEHQRAMQFLKQEHAAKYGDLESQIRCFLQQQAENEAMIKHLQRDLTAHKTHIQTLTNKLEQVQSDMELKYHNEIQDLKDWALVEQEEKNDLNKKLQNAEKELIISRAKLVEKHQDSTLNHHIETLKQKVMKLRKENEVLKRKLLVSEEG
ncbi:PREDICTED: protein At-4/1 [Nelumbo nucifera]|uniref:Protein At-4/1 n=2 Tax=Nelumbo nucifera TaxID=4432 RepID=A0A1U8B6R4_NELNU|nr:PREDICTED: protein At-4/1 [Nelumbo nucifera]DAD45866.1 TPA_asm: hypothetical protein HUJ06_004096 [Nelumbo nucifera]